MIGIHIVYVSRRGVTRSPFRSSALQSAMSVASTGVNVVMSGISHKRSSPAADDMHLFLVHAVISAGMNVITIPANSTHHLPLTASIAWIALSSCPLGVHGRAEQPRSSNDERCM
jgi:hypothetical protein